MPVVAGADPIRAQADAEGEAERTPPPYDPEADWRWLLLRPWIWIPRLLVILWTLGTLALTLAAQGNSRNQAVQRRVAEWLAQHAPR